MIPLPPTKVKRPTSARWIIASGALLLLLVISWCWRRPIGGVGGLPIPGELVIMVPQFFQGDPRWSDELLGDTPGTLGGEGCAVASASMALGFYGMDVDPGRLNRFLKENKGYEGKAWLRWESVAEFTPDLVEKAYEDLPSYALIDWNLLRGNPVIIRIRRPDGITHFVVIVGKQGFDYLIRDPAGYGTATSGSVYPLVRLGVPIEALRYYRRIR
ncbi:MAG: C39 family peptidase [Chthoniobacterales bacterium]